MALTQDQRKYIASEIERLHLAEMSINIDAAALCVTKLLMAFPASNSSEEANNARAEGFITAFEDIPAWAVESACRKWLRGEAEGQKNLSFAPTPPQLREIAMRELTEVRRRRVRYDMLLRAEEQQSFSPEHRKKMLQKLETVFQDKAS